MVFLCGVPASAVVQSPDGLGKIIEYSTVKNDRREVSYFPGTTNITTNIKTTFTSADFQYGGSGSFNAVGVDFALPGDVYSGTGATTYFDFYVQFSIKGHVNYPTVKSYFNVFSDYCHSKVGLTIVPDLSFSMSGNNAGFGLGVSLNHENTYAVAEVNYIP